MRERSGWKRAGVAATGIDFQRAVVLENIGKVASVKVDGAKAPPARAYADSAARTVLLVFTGDQRGEPETLVVEVAMQ